MYCRAPTRPYSFFGDGGALLSIGLLQNISFVDIEECIAGQWSTGEPLSTSASFTCKTAVILTSDAHMRQSCNSTPCVACAIPPWASVLVSSAGGDAFLTACLWKFGIALTSPNLLWHPDGLSLFDATSALLPDPISQHSIPVKVSRHVGNLLASIAGFCNALCEVGSGSHSTPWWLSFLVCRAPGSKDPACASTPHLHYC